ncbi:unnamed protein product, partial [Allacma fusca]
MFALTMIRPRECHSKGLLHSERISKTTPGVSYNNGNALMRECLIARACCSTESQKQRSE